MLAAFSGVYRESSEAVWRVSDMLAAMDGSGGDIRLSPAMQSWELSVAGIQAGDLHNSGGFRDRSDI